MQNINMFEFCLAQARADRAMRAIMSERLQKFHITMMEWLALGVISSGARQGYSMSQIAEVLDVTLPQVTALVNLLVEKKLTKQKILASDRRGRQVTVTLKGKRTLHKIEGLAHKAMKNWTADIPKAQMEIYLLTVKQLSVKAVSREEV